MTPDSDNVLAVGAGVVIRRIEADDLRRISEFPYSVSVHEPLGDLARLIEVFDETGLWADDAGAVAIVENSSDRMIGTLQYFRSAPTIHGVEIGYLIHDPADRSKGYAATALQLLSGFLFDDRAGLFRQQLLIEVWNTASWKVAERSGFVREGMLRSSGFGDDPADSFVYSRTRRDHGQYVRSLGTPD